MKIHYDPTNKWLINNLRTTSRVSVAHPMHISALHISSLQLMLDDAATRIEELAQEVHDRSADCESYCCTIDIEMELRQEAEAKLSQDITGKQFAEQIKLNRTLQDRINVLESRHIQDVKYVSNMTQTWADAGRTMWMVHKLDDIANLINWDHSCSCEEDDCAICSITTILEEKE